MTPDQATLILNSVGLPSLHAEHAVTRSIIAAIPADKGDYRPDSIARSAIDLAWHIGEGTVDLRRELRRAHGARGGSGLNARQDLFVDCALVLNP